MGICGGMETGNEIYGEEAMTSSRRYHNWAADTETDWQSRVRRAWRDSKDSHPSGCSPHRRAWSHSTLDPAAQRCSLPLLCIPKSKYTHK